jgi:5'-3' exonuclease
MPYYLLKHKFSDIDREDSVNIIYSRDKDMLQCLEFENSYQFYRAANCDKTDYITQETLFTHFCKMECKPVRDAAKWFPLVLSLCGDSGDGIPGIKGLGPKNIYKNIDTIMKAFDYNADKMYQRVMNGDNLLTESWEYSSTPTLTKIFSNSENLARNMKLISYRALSEYILGGFPTSTIELKNYIDKIWDNKDKLSSYKILWDNLVKKGLTDIIDIRIVEECFL